MKTHARSLTLVFASIVVAAFCVPLVGCGGKTEVSIRDVVADIHTEKQAVYLDSPRFDVLPSGVAGDLEYSKPPQVMLEWGYNIPNKVLSNVASVKVEVARGGDFSAADVYTVDKSEVSCAVSNLFAQSSYQCRVSYVDGDGSAVVSATSSFVTGAAPRLMDVGGVTNVRDLGGYVRDDGTLVKQGMIYRCGQLNLDGASAVTPVVTDEGKRVMLDDMGVKTEIDLRGRTNENGGLTDTSVLGDGVDYKLIAMDWESTIFNRKAQIVEFFDILAEPASYPIIFHCKIGTDRTGLCAFLVNALLGVSEEDLYRDYMFSNFADIDGSRNTSAIDSVINEACSYDGDSLAEKTEALLLSYGVSQADIDSVRSILSTTERPVAADDREAVARRHALGTGNIDMTAIPNVAAWVRYGKSGTTTSAGSDDIIFSETDGIRNLTATSDGFYFRCDQASENYEGDVNVKLNGVDGARSIKSTSSVKTASVDILADERTDRIILYVGTSGGNGEFGATLARGSDVLAASVGRVGGDLKNIYRIDFELDLDEVSVLTLTLDCETAKVLDIAGIAVTEKA